MHTQQRFYQYRGPDSSEDYNNRIEENYKDLVYLYNLSEKLSGLIDAGSSSALKNLNALVRHIDVLEARIAALEANDNTISMTSNSQVDNNRFNSTAYNITSSLRCSYLGNDDGLTLPKIESSSVSKLKFYDSAGVKEIIPSSVETLVVPISSSADTSSSVIETSQPYHAITSKPGVVWERNVITSTPDLVDGAQMYFFVRIPDELTASADSNCLVFSPFPAFNVDVLEISYSVDPNVKLGNASTWTPFNYDQIYYQADGASGNLIPGGWSGDEIVNCGPKIFYFDPKPITAIRMKLRQNNYFTKGANYIYSYGLSSLDIRNDKFLDTGKCIIRFDAPASDTISSVTSVTPYIWNVAESFVNDVFSYRLIWETSYNSGVYTTSSVPLSKRVWVEVTLNKTLDGGTPQLTNLVLNYS